MPGLNALANDDALPEMVALMMGDNDSLDEFILLTEPEFTTQLLDELVIMQFIKSAPPILYHVRDGMFLNDWEWEDDPPTPAQLSGEVSTSAP